MNFYNEHDPKAAAWIRELILVGEIPEGTVDERSIEDIKPADLAGFTQCHFFAGIAGWSYALKLAGWPASRPVWTASLPCQPFSHAGKQLGVEDERHLWPVFFDLVKECRPDVIFGEQVARAIGFNWLDGICADLEAANYAVGQVVLGAHSLGAPHKRQRLYWLADATSGGLGIDGRAREGERHADQRSETGDAQGVTKCEGLEGQSRHGNDGDESGRLGTFQVGSTAAAGDVSGMAITDGGNTSVEREQRSGEHGQQPEDGSAGALAHAGLDAGRSEHGEQLQDDDSGARQSGPWGNYELLWCRDEKFRRIESSTFPLVDVLPKGMVPSGDPSLQEVQATAEGRTMRLRGYGNAIVPHLAAEFIRAYDVG